jgi:uncharacterized membrane protein
MPLDEVKMLDRTLFLLTFTAMILSVLVAGVFFAFSNFIMPAFGRIRAEYGVALFGTALLSVLLAIGAVMGLGQPAQIIIVLAALIYVAGCTGVTMVCNVPLNNALAAVQPGVPDTAGVWTRYLSDWTFWNHVRTAASAIAGILFGIALLYWPPVG